MADESKTPREQTMTETFRVQYGANPDIYKLQELVYEFGGEVVGETHDALEVQIEKDQATELMRRYAERDASATWASFRKLREDKINSELTDKLHALDRLHSDLVDLYIELAGATEPNTVNGANARRWAVKNARLAGYDDTVEELVERFSTEEGATESMQRWLLGNNWIEALHLQCVEASVSLQRAMEVTQDSEVATCMGTSVMMLREAAEEIERWEGASSGAPPWELRESADQVGLMLATIETMNFGRAEERETVLRDTSEATAQMIGQAARWVRYHSGIATQAAITTRRYARDLQVQESRISELEKALQWVLGSETLEEAKMLAARELAVSEGVDGAEGDGDVG